MKIVEGEEGESEVFGLLYEEPSGSELNRSCRANRVDENEIDDRVERAV